MAMPNANEEARRAPLWTARDVADYLKVSRSWVYWHAEAGNLPSVKIGGHRRFFPDEIEAYVRGSDMPPRTVIPLPGTGRR